MIDQAGIIMAGGKSIALEQISGVNDNMSMSHYHEYFEFYYLDAGERLHMINDDVYHTKAGDFMLFAPYTMHHSYGEKDIPFSRIVLYFKPDAITYQSLLDELYSATGTYRPEVHTTHLIRRYLYQLMEEQEHPGNYHEEYLSSMLNTMFFNIMRTKNTTVNKVKNDRITQILEYIHTHYQEDLSVHSLATKFYISDYYLCRQFKKFTNKTIIQYIHTTRIMYAQRMFMETGLSVSEVSYRSGFSNLTHFNRVFKDQTGMTPSQFKKKFKNQKNMVPGTAHT